MVKDFHQLTRLGKIHRLHTVVNKALENYDLEVQGVEFLAEFG